MLEKITVKDKGFLQSPLPHAVRTAIRNLEHNQLDRFYRAVRVWYDVTEKKFSFEDRE
jgi:hypothetical protein